MDGELELGKTRWLRNWKIPNGLFCAVFCTGLTVSQILTVLFENETSFLNIYRVLTYKSMKMMLNYTRKGLIFDSFLIKIQSRIEVHAWKSNLFGLWFGTLYFFICMPTSKTAISTSLGYLDFDWGQFQATGNWPKIAEKCNSAMQNLCNWQIVQAGFTQKVAFATDRKALANNVLPRQEQLENCLHLQQHNSWLFAICQQSRHFKQKTFH